MKFVPKQLHNQHVVDSHLPFIKRKLLENRGKRPLLESTNACNKNACVMLPLQAMNQNRVVCTIENDRKRLQERLNDFIWCRRELEITRTTGSCIIDIKWGVDKTDIVIFTKRTQILSVYTVFLLWL